MPPPRWAYLSKDDIVQIHERAIRFAGGIPGILNPDHLESCVAQPKTAVFGVERFTGAAEKAAAYCFFLVRSHPFIDGNKRTGFLAALQFLADNGYTLVIDHNEMYDAIDAVIKGGELPDLVDVIRGAIESAD